MKPFWHDGFFSASSIIPTTKSSETSSPWKKNLNIPYEMKKYSRVSNLVRKYNKNLTLSIASLALMPRGVLAATAALNMSPVARWHKQYSSFMIGDWVPFPDPGGPVLPNFYVQHYKCIIDTQRMMKCTLSYNFSELIWSRLLKTLKLMFLFFRHFLY